MTFDRPYLLCTLFVELRSNTNVTVLCLRKWTVCFPKRDFDESGGFDASVPTKNYIKLTFPLRMYFEKREIPGLKRLLNDEELHLLSFLSDDIAEENRSLWDERVEAVLASWRKSGFTAETVPLLTSYQRFFDEVFARIAPAVQALSELGVPLVLFFEKWRSITDCGFGIWTPLAAQIDLNVSIKRLFYFEIYNLEMRFFEVFLNKELWSIVICYLLYITL